MWLLYAACHRSVCVVWSYVVEIKVAMSISFKFFSNSFGFGPTRINEVGFGPTRIMYR